MCEPRSPEKDLTVFIYQNADPRPFGDSRQKTTVILLCPAYHEEAEKTSMRRLIKAEHDDPAP